MCAVAEPAEIGFCHEATSASRKNHQECTDGLRVKRIPSLWANGCAPVARTPAMGTSRFFSRGTMSATCLATSTAPRRGTVLI